MIYPKISDLLSKVDSRYTLVIEAAKRARQIAEQQNDGSYQKLVDCKSDKPVTIATNEIDQGKVTYKRSERLKKTMTGEISETALADMKLHEVDLYQEE